MVAVVSGVALLTGVLLGRFVSAPRVLWQVLQEVNTLPINSPSILG